MVYSTYLGGSDDDEPRRIFVDVLGNVYVAGSTRSANFPLTPNAAQRTFGGGGDAFVAKLNPAGSQLIYSTYLGGSGTDVLLGFSLDNALNAYVCGLTTSTDFPRSPGSFGPTFGGDQDGFVAKLNTAGSQLLYSGYLGGRAADAATAIAVTSFGEAFVTGWTRSPNFPTAQPLQEALGGGVDAFLVKLLPDGIGLEYASYLGGNRDDVGTSVMADPDDDSTVLVAGFTDSSNFPRAERNVVADLGEFNTFVAGFAIRLALAATEDPSSGELFGGITRDPRPAGGGDPVRERRIVIIRRLAKCLKRAGREIEHELVRQSVSRAIGAAVSALSRTPAGAALNPLTDKLADWACSQLAQEDSFAPGDESRQSPPSTPGSIEILNLTTLQFEPGPALPGPEGSATPVGVAFDRFGTFHILAESENPALPVSATGTIANRGTIETYVMRFSENPPPPPGPPPPTPPPANAPRITSALNGASFSTTAPGVTPGSIVSLFGERLAASTAQAASTPLPTTLGGASVTVAGRPAPLFYVAPGQVNLQAPWETPAGPAPVVVTAGGVAGAAVNLNIVAAAPGIFTFGANRAVVQNQDFSVNTAENPARAGSIITAYLTGGGGFDNAARLQTGVPTPADPLNRVSSLAFSATLGGQAADVLFLGLTPGLIGVVQANLRVPNLSAGNYPLVVTIGGVASNGPLVTVAAN